jgi:hypothetical protein
MEEDGVEDEVLRLIFCVTLLLASALLLPA